METIKVIVHVDRGDTRGSGQGHFTKLKDGVYYDVSIDYLVGRTKLKKWDA